MQTLFDIDPLPRPSSGLSMNAAQKRAVEHRDGPLLVIAGHAGCGAVKAAMGDFSKEPDAIRRELETLDLSPLSFDRVLNNAPLVERNVV